MSGGDASVAELHARLLASSGFAEGAVAAERLQQFLARRARELGLDSPGGAARRALGDAGEFALVEAHFAPPESWLFRYPGSFELLREHLSVKRAAPARVLALGAGGWAEPLSIAAAALSTGTRASIEAIDRNPALAEPPVVLDGAALRAGVPGWAARAFVRLPASGGDALRPDPALGAMVSWSVGEVVAEARARAAAGARYDAVFFRNVSIYMATAARRAAFEAIAGLLAPEGLLFVGHAEVGLAAELAGLASHAHSAAFALEPHRRTASVERAPAVTALDTGFREAPRPRPSEPSDPLERLRAEIASRPLDATLLVALARMLDARGDRADAVAAIGRALYIDAAHEEALVLAARYAEERGAAAEADRFRMRALRAHLGRNDSSTDPPTDPPTAFRRGLPPQGA